MQSVGRVLVDRGVFNLEAPANQRISATLHIVYGDLRES